MTRSGRGHIASALLERIVDAPSNLIVLETRHGEELLEEMRVRARLSGQALYSWTRGAGLRSLRDGSMQVQVTGSLTDTLRFVARSMHFGIYLLQLEGITLTPEHVLALGEIGRMQDGPARRVVLLGLDACADPRIAAASLRLRVSGQDEARPRLRDGRWVR